MAERRMFSKTVIDSDTFLDMPPTTQNLYFHLSMRADDDGFVNNPKKIQRMVGANEEGHPIKGLCAAFRHAYNSQCVPDQTGSIARAPTRSKALEYGGILQQRTKAYQPCIFQRHRYKQRGSRSDQASGQGRIHLNDFESSERANIYFRNFRKPIKRARESPPSMCLQSEGKGTVKGASLSQKRKFTPF